MAGNSPHFAVFITTIQRGICKVKGLELKFAFMSQMYYEIYHFVSHKASFYQCGPYFLISRLKL